MNEEIKTETENTESDKKPEGEDITNLFKNAFGNENADEKAEKDPYDKKEVTEEKAEEEKKPAEEQQNEKEDLMLAAAEKIKKLEAENAELKDKYVRAHAEMENIRRRAQAETEKKANFAITEFARDLLSVSDNFSRAIQSIPEEVKKDKLIKDLVIGIEMTEKELHDVFERHGIKAIKAIDEIFDPNIHRAVQEIEDTSKIAGTIVQEAQIGYMIKDRLLRESMVVVSKGGPKSAEKDNPPGKKVDTTI